MASLTLMANQALRAHDGVRVALDAFTRALLWRKPALFEAAAVSTDLEPRHAPPGGRCMLLSA
jgi:hypothetical protein